MDKVPPTKKHSKPQSDGCSITNYFKPISKESLKSEDKENESPESPAVINNESNITTTKPKSSPFKFTKSEPPSETKLHPQIMRCLKQQFKLTQFRSLQYETIVSILQKRDTLTLMATGSGKSLCYQLPAILWPQYTSFVIFPTKALIESQYERLKTLNISSEILNGNTKSVVLDKLYKQYKQQLPRLILTTPETMICEQVLSLCNKLYEDKKLLFFALDEAHLIIEWGQTFRQKYLQLNILREQYKEIPMLLVTGTATVTTRHSILNILQLNNVKTYQSSFNRHNINLEIRYVESKWRTVMELLQQHPNDTIIIYCTTIKQVKVLKKQLKLQQLNGISCFHSKRKEGKKKQVLTDWNQDKIRIMVATVSFGLGIDKSNVHGVILYDLPLSMEEYVQKVGRAGRDESIQAYSVLLYNNAVKQRALDFVGYSIKKTERAEGWKMQADNVFCMINYCEQKNSCRRKRVLSYFGESESGAISNEGFCCDVCSATQTNILMPQGDENEDFDDAKIEHKDGISF